MYNSKVDLTLRRMVLFLCGGIRDATITNLEPEHSNGITRIGIEDMEEYKYITM